VRIFPGETEGVSAVVVTTDRDDAVVVLVDREAGVTAPRRRPERCADRDLLGRPAIQMIR